MRDELLQRYFDDELPPEARRRVEAMMRDADYEKLAQLALLRALLREYLPPEDAEQK